MAGSESDKKAQQLFDDGERRLKKFFSFGNKWEDAQELFSGAANKWKAGKNWKGAAEAYSRVADCHTQLDSKHEAAGALVEAAACYRKAGELDRAVTCYQQANEMYIDMGRFTTAAKYEKEVGEVFRAEGDVDKAVKHYRKAADYYHGEDQTSGANSCLLLIAELCSLHGRYAEAAELYEQVARGCLDPSKRLLMYHTKEHLFKAMLCHLALVTAQPGPKDVEKARQTMARYTSMDIHFNGGRDYELLEHLIQAVEAQDEDQLARAVAEYDAVCPLDDWKTTLLLAIKRGIAPEEGDSNLDLR